MTRLESALFSTMAGLNGHSKAIAVLGDNVSNVNTVGYKRSRTEFVDIVTSLGNQSERIASTGNGVHVPEIRQVHKAGVIEPTGRSLDMAIEGTGFFQVGDPTNPSLTRAGNFQVDEEGFLSTASGDRVLGVAAGSTAEQGPEDPREDREEAEGAGQTGIQTDGPDGGPAKDLQEDRQGRR